jgi:myb proto-oncogene protein
MHNQTSFQKKKCSKLWSWNDDQILINSLSENNSNKKINWAEISTKFTNKTPRQCYARARQIDPKFSKGLWTDDENNLLFEYIKKLGKNWAKISKLMVNRSSKQIRDHYVYLLGDKTDFTKKEDNLLKNLILKHGTKFKQISKYFQNRTADKIKNRYYSFIKRTIEEEENKNFKNNNNNNKYSENKPKKFRKNMKVLQILNSTSQQIPAPIEENKNIINNIYDVDDSPVDSIKRLSNNITEILLRTNNNNYNLISNNTINDYAVSNNASKLNFLDANKSINLFDPCTLNFRTALISTLSELNSKMNLHFLNNEQNFQCSTLNLQSNLYLIFRY